MSPSAVAGGKVQTLSRKTKRLLKNYFPVIIKRFSVFFSLRQVLLIGRLGRSVLFRTEMRTRPGGWRRGLWAWEMGQDEELNVPHDGLPMVIQRDSRILASMPHDHWQPTLRLWLAAAGWMRCRSLGLGRSLGANAVIPVEVLR